MQVGNGDNGSDRGSPLAGSAVSMLMARKGAGTTQTLSEINVTPFVDVVLVLLIIFMITAPMLMRSMDVSLPSATLQRDSPSERTIVTLDAQGRTFVNDRAVNIELLEDEIRQRVEVEQRTTEVRAPLEREPDLREAFEIVELTNELLPMLYEDDLARTGDAETYAAAYAGFARAFAEATLRENLFVGSTGSAAAADDIADTYFRRLQDLFAAEPGCHGFEHQVMTLVLRRR